jgi:hypothetical protein
MARRTVALRLGAVAAPALAVAAAAALAGACSKAKEPGAPAAPVADEVIAVPTGAKVAAPGSVAGGEAAARAAAPRAADPTAGGATESFRLRREEGSISIELPPGAKAGAETTAKVIVTPGPSFKINFEFPTKLSLTQPEGVALAKTELSAGGASQAKGDAETFEEKQLAFAVRLTPTAAGSHTVSGTFKFAVCDKDQCLPKREAIAIQVAAQ